MSTFSRVATHIVGNQPPPLPEHDAFACDAALRASLPDAPEPALLERLTALGHAVGDRDWIARGFAANEHTPELRVFDRHGHRIDEVVFHPAYHELMALGMRRGVHSVAWGEPRDGHAVHAALLYLLTQLEPGVCCPLAMTHAAQPVLRRHLPSDADILVKSRVNEYDARTVPLAHKRSVTLGMAMTEKQGGSDVRTNRTRASPLGDSGDYRLVGHKWFCSAPMSDAFLTLARTEGGLSCFLVPRWLPDGTRNRMLLQRLKHKLGNRANASAEIEFDDAFATRLGAEGAGIVTIIDMVQATRLDAAVAPAGLMRQALVQAIHHARYRQAFGRALLEQPLMRNVLSDLAIESEAATLLAMRAARAVDGGADDAREREFSRLATIIAKYWINKQAPQFVYEAMECLGGGGYIEESILPRLYREAPVNSIWEGSGNVMGLDLLRVLERAPTSLDAFDAVVGEALGEHRLLAERHRQLHRELDRCRTEPALARRGLESLALVLQGALLFELAPIGTAMAFAESRLGAGRCRGYGTLDGVESERVLERAWPELDGASAA